MFEIFKTVFLLSCLGGSAVLILLLLKPITVKKFPARWQYLIWLVVTVCMIIPAWKFIPQRDVQMLAPTRQAEQTEMQENIENASTVRIDNTPMEYREIPISPSKKIRI